MGSRDLEQLVSRSDISIIEDKIDPMGDYTSDFNTFRIERHVVLYTTEKYRDHSLFGRSYFQPRCSFGDSAIFHCYIGDAPVKFIEVIECH